MYLTWRSTLISPDRHDVYAMQPTVIEKISASQRVWFVSDLHLGDGTPSDVFFGKDRHLMALLANVEREQAVLVVGGDAMDFHQAWTFTRILEAHHDLLSTMSRLARDGKLLYVVGNHDHDLRLYRDILNFQVCDEIHIGDKILVQHGHQYDPYMANHLDNQWGTKVHHLIERYLQTWIRLPLGEFYTLPNRLAAWLIHKTAVTLAAWTKLKKFAGYPASWDRLQARLDFWARSNLGDPMCIFRPIRERLTNDRWPIIISGHSHLPGVVPVGDRFYANTGSWTFSSSQYLVWDGEKLTSKDWLTGREFHDELYRPMLDGTIDEKNFWIWWRENYMGWLRFREGEERKGRLRGWESYIRDSQYLAQLNPSPYEPLPKQQEVTGVATSADDAPVEKAISG